MSKEIYSEYPIIPLIPVVLVEQDAYNQMLQQDIAKTNALYITNYKKENYKAAYQNAIQTLQAEINNRNSDINKIQENGSYLIHQACSEWNLEYIKFLVDNGAQTNVLDLNFRTPLHVFASMQNEGNIHPTFHEASEAIHFLTKQYPENYLSAYLNMREGFFGFSALHFAVVNNHLDIAAGLLEFGADTTLTDRYGRNSFQLASTISDEAEKQRMIELIMTYFPTPEPIIRSSYQDAAVQNITSVLDEETQTITEHSEQNIQTDLSLYHLQAMEIESEALELKAQQLTESLAKAQRDQKQQDKIVLELQEKLLKSEKELEESKIKVSQQNKKLFQQESLLTQAQNQVKKIEESSAITKAINSNLELVNQKLATEIDQLKKQIEQSSHEKEMTLSRLDLQKSLIINFTSQGSFEIAQHLIENDPNPAELFTAKTDIDNGSCNLLQMCASVPKAERREMATDFIFQILPESEIVRQSTELNSYGLGVAEMCCRNGGNIALLKKLLEKGVIDPNVKSSVHGQTHRSLLEVAVTNKSSMNLEAAAALIEFGADIKQPSPAHLIKFKREGKVADLIKANNDGKVPEIIADAVRKSLTKKLGLSSPDSSSVTNQKGDKAQEEKELER